jgi:hypothetical protein
VAIPEDGWCARVGGVPIGPAARQAVNEVLPWVALGLAAGDAVVLGLWSVLLTRFVAQEWRRAEAERRLLPLALAFLDGAVVEIGDLTTHEHRALAGVLARHGRQLARSTRHRIVSLFEQQDRVAREVAVLSDRSAWRRVAAAYALGDIGSVRAVDGLRRALVDPDPAVRVAAAHSLGRIGGGDAVEPIVRAFAAGRLPRASTGQALASLGIAAHAEFERLTADADDVVRGVCTTLVGLHGSAIKVGLLLNLLTDPSPDVRAAAARGLGQRGTSHVAPALAALLQDPSATVRVAAVEALGLVGGDDALEPLLELANDDAFEPAAAASVAAARIDPARVAAAAGETGASPHLREAADLLALGLLP